MFEEELLDFCRIKKIFDKGFGFLTSLYYRENVFFHFSKIRDDSVKQKLVELKRGEVYIYYTSRLKDGKRKVARLWLEIKNVDRRLLPKFKYRLIEEFNAGRTNIFELAYVVSELRFNNLLNEGEFNKILRSEKVIKIPSAIAAMLNDTELSLFEGGAEYFKKYDSATLSHEEWVSSINQTINKHSSTG